MNIDQLKQFIRNRAMASAVYDILQYSFLNRKGSRGDVNMLAAERIALDLLKDAWKELEKYKDENEKLSTPTRQVGL